MRHESEVLLSNKFVFPVSDCVYYATLENVIIHHYQYSSYIRNKPLYEEKMVLRCIIRFNFKIIKLTKAKSLGKFAGPGSRPVLFSGINEFC